MLLSRWRASAARRLSTAAPSKTHDLVVVGGGSGGLAAAREAARLGARVAVLDRVEASPKGTTWGLGGTCVNVGCIPKKLFHAAALAGEAAEDAAAFGWEGATRGGAHSWEALAGAVRGHVRSLNWGYRVALRDEGVEYVNARGSLLPGGQGVAADAPDGGPRRVLRAPRVILATGTRPRELDAPGGELAVTSDDIWTLERPPGRTLVVGGSYIALETAGMLAGLGGGEVVVMARSVLLRGMDRQMAALVGQDLEARGVRVRLGARPAALSPAGDGRVSVRGDDGTEEVFDTVVAAVGRAPRGLDAAGVELHPASGRVVGGHCGEAERSSEPGVYAIGDVLHGAPELTPVAIRAGRLLAARMFGASPTPPAMDYGLVPTCVFTPLEYAFVGASEEEAAAAEPGGPGALEVYHAHFKPLEWAFRPGADNSCYTKVVARRGGDGAVLGVHFLGPNAGEVVQGFAAAMAAGVTAEQLRATVGIHPTCAEEVVRADVTKRSGKDPRRTGC